MIDEQTQSYTFGRIVALVESSVDNLPADFAANSIRSPRGYFTKWFKASCTQEGEHQKQMCDLVCVLDPEWVFPAGMPMEEQTKAWEGYNRQRTTDTRAAFGKRISELRKSKGLTQEELSALSGITSTNISKIEKGKYNVSVDLLTKLMLALDADYTIQ